MRLRIEVSAPLGPKGNADLLITGEGTNGWQLGDEVAACLIALENGMFPLPDVGPFESELPDDDPEQESD